MNSSTDVSVCSGEGLSIFMGGWKPYEEVIQSVVNTNCILEVMQDNQEGATLRYLEAVVYNKKLLTNNKSITTFPFYNPQYMKIFETVDDIDINWIKNQDVVDYGYKDEFSPKRLSADLNKIIMEQS